MTENRYRWIILILSYFLMLVFAFTLQSLPPILTLIIKDLGLTHAQAGLLMSLFALPPIFLAIFSGMFCDRFGAFRTGVISLILVVIGNFIFSLSMSFLFASLGRIVSGIGAVTLAVVSAQTISQWFKGREIGSAMGIYSTAMPAGTIITFMAFGPLGERFGWQIPVSISGAMGIIVFLAFLFLYRPSPNVSQGSRPETKADSTGVLSAFWKVGASIWLVALCWMWFNATVISFSTFAPDFFVSKGNSLSFSGSLASLLMWGSLILSPVIGCLVDKYENNDLFVAVSGLIMAIMIYLISRSTDFLLPMIIMAVGVALAPTPIFSFTSRIVAPENLGLGFGILSMVSSAGMVFGPYLAGMVKDETGSYEMSFLFLSGLSLLVTITAIILRARTSRVI